MSRSSLDIRITSIWQNTKTKVLFSGVPISASKRSTTSKYVVVTCPASLMPMHPVVGQHWHIYGEKSEQIINNGRHIQTRIDIQAERLRVTLPETGDNFVDFIAGETDFVGVGEVFARKLWTHFQKDVYRILDEGDIESLSMILTKQTATIMVEAWKKYSNLRHLNWFADHAIPPHISFNIIKYHDDRAVEAIKTNPYTLLSFGMDFKAADKLSQQHFKIGKADPRRLTAAVEEALYRFLNRGHTVVKHAELAPILRNILDCPKLTKQALMLSHENGDFIIGENGNYHPLSALVMEKTVAHHLKALAAQTAPWTIEMDIALSVGTEKLPYPLLERQFEAVTASLSNRVSVITGGAGTGKTTVLRVILNAYKNLGYQIYPMALAGRAAKRIYEGTGFHAITIAGFLKNVTIPDDQDAIVVIDEASMVDLQTMFRIVMTLHSRVRVLFVGDPGQLPPIGYGLVLHDIVKSQAVPNTELNVVKRQDGSTGIPEFTAAVRNGVIPAFNSQHIRFHETDKSNTNQVIADLYRQSSSNSLIIAATYKAECAGIDALNQLCQQQCNPNGKRLEFKLHGELMFLNIREGDPVIFIENEWNEDIQNGTMGVLIDASKGVVDLDEGRSIKLTDSLLQITKLAYAVSLHKAQGSQFSNIIVALSDSHMLDRSWVYTALTRAEKKIDIVGELYQWERAIRRVGTADIRQTKLHELLRA